MNALTTSAPVASGALSLDHETDPDLRDFILAEKAASSREGYAADFQLFRAWCAFEGRRPRVDLPVKFRQTG